MIAQLFKALFNLTTNAEVLATTMGEANQVLRDGFKLDAAKAELRMIEATAATCGCLRHQFATRLLRMAPAGGML